MIKFTIGFLFLICTSLVQAQSISISETGFVENDSNNGSVRGNIEILLNGDAFSKQELVLGEDYAIAAVPSGLTPALEVTQIAGSLWVAETAAIDSKWLGVTYGNGIFVAIALEFDGNVIMKSEDGINWELVPYDGGVKPIDIIYANGKFLIVGLGNDQNERIITSTDGVEWTNQQSPNISWGFAAYGNDTFVAFSRQSSDAMTSPDGIIWTQQEVGDDEFNWGSITFGNGLFVVVGATGDNRILTSPDGVNWTPRQAPEQNSWSSVTYGNGHFVAVSTTGTNRVMTSPDGITWTSQEGINNSSWFDITYGDGTFVAVAGNGSQRVMTSTDNGVTWTNQENFINAKWHNITYGDGQFVAVATEGVNRVMRTPSRSIAQLTFNGNADAHEDINDISNLTLQLNDSAFTISNSSEVMNAEGPIDTALGIDFIDAPLVTYSGSGFTETASNMGEVSGEIIIDIEGDVFNSTPLTAGIDYEITNLPSGLVPEIEVALAGADWESGIVASPIQWESIVYGNGLFVAVASGPSTLAMTSLDGLDWTTRIAAASSDWSSVAYGNGVFVAVARDGDTRVMISTNGIDWQPVDAPEQNAWESITYGNGTFIAVASNGENRVMRSGDGLNWELFNSSEQNSWKSVTYGDEGFVAVSSDGTNQVMQSFDGAQWGNWMSTQPNTWESVVYGLDKYVAISSDGDNRVMYSTNGLSWETGSSPVNNTWRDITYGAGVFVAVSNDGENMVMTSLDGINWTLQEEAITASWEAVTYGGGQFAAVARLMGTGTGAMISKASTQAILTLTGAASNNESSDDISDLLFTFSDSVFNKVQASNITNATGPANSNLGIDFNDADCELVIQCSDDVFIVTGENSCFGSVTLVEPTTNGCEGEEVTNDAPSEFPLGETIVTWTLTRAEISVTCTQLVTVQDEQDPVFSCPADYTVTVEEGEAYSIGDIFIEQSIEVQDNCSGGITLNQSPDIGEQLAIGENTITLSVADESDNVTTCTFLITVDETLGVNANSLTSSLELYPNPSKGMVNVSNSEMSFINQVLVYDLSGRLLLTKEFNSVKSVYELDLSHLESSIYFLKISDDKSSVTKRLILDK